MVEWAKGYVSDVGYTSGFYRESTPAQLSFAPLTLGRSPGLALNPKRILELGFGQGFGLCLLAAANPDIEFEGFDFNPEHLANAQRLIRGAGLNNVKVSESSFEEAAARPGENDVDVIIMHGIFSWVSAETQQAILSIIRQRLRPNGALYISYNSMPGWGSLIPIKQFLMAVRKQQPGRSYEGQLATGFDLLKRLKDSNTGYFGQNPVAAAHLNAMMTNDPAYLAHEYLHENWVAFQFSEVVGKLSEAKLAFLCSATLVENFDQYTCVPDMLPTLASIEDPIMRETLRDYAVNKRFRRDIFARGISPLTPAEQRRMLSGLRFTLLIDRQRVVYKLPVPIGEVQGKPELYDPIADLLAQKVATFDELVALPQFGEANLAILLSCLSLLVNSGQVIVITSSPTVDMAPGRRFNQMVVDEMKAGQFYGFVAAPAAGGGMGMMDLSLLTLSAIWEGQGDDAAAVAKYGMAVLKKLNRSPLKDGKVVQNEAEGMKVLEERMQPILDELVPVWKRLGIL